MQKQEEYFEPIFRKLRFGMSLKHISKDIGVLLDLGCGPLIPYYHFLSEKGYKISKYFGFDPLLDENVLNENYVSKVITLIKKQVKDLENIDGSSIDVVTGFAFIEHIENPGYVINQSIRMLKPGGLAIFTTPTKIAKPVLEFLSFKLHLVSEREIAEHKNYFQKKDLENLVDSANKDCVEIHHEYFEFGFNNILVIKKIK